MPRNTSSNTVVYVWTCHNCGYGAMTVAVNDACCECGHLRCEICTSEYHKVRSNA
ncbi:hypothetical protein QBC33DRAFT_557739 [Phialemonium atrogriseum]|uniref:Uncharacterized protein n=1 Tax=Phialemonium atrogriseum TaxID=1093897 RepID=A0AAJ0C5A3_9PEZI|nr:uncharacterized protein QBC33DRAFT_557739 [Phialemonium atrogriseum]KAK1768982.1 hypothetical protein QBC33DRAFT_557739 [Phialemonium atrogriseum]